MSWILRTGRHCKLTAIKDEVTGLIKIKTEKANHQLIQ